MDRDSLFDAWQANKDRPAWVRENRDEIHDQTNTSEAIPDGSIYEVRQWLQSYKGAVTRQLQPDDDPDADADDSTDADGDGETPTAAAAEGGR